MVLTCKQAPQAERATQLQGMGSLNVAQAQEAGPARGSARHHHQPDQSVRTDGVTDSPLLAIPLATWPQREHRFQIYDLLAGL